MFLPLVNYVQTCVAAVSIGLLILMGLQSRTSSWEKQSLDLGQIFFSLLDTCGLKVKNEKLQITQLICTSFFSKCLSSFLVFNPYSHMLEEPFLISLELPRKNNRASSCLFGLSACRLMLVPEFAYSGCDSALAFAVLEFLWLLTTGSSLVLRESTAL